MKEVKEVKEEESALVQACEVLAESAQEHICSGDNPCYFIAAEAVSDLLGALYVKGDMDRYRELGDLLAPEREFWSASDDIADIRSVMDYIRREFPPVWGKILADTATELFCENIGIVPAGDE